jgi:hypothetical protein
MESYLCCNRLNVQATLNRMLSLMVKPNTQVTVNVCHTSFRRYGVKNSNDARVDNELGSVKEETG